MSAPGRDVRADAGLAAAGGPLVVRYAALTRTARTHDAANEAFVRLRDEFVSALRELFGAGETEVVLAASGGHLWLNGARIRPAAGRVGAMHALLADLAARGCGGVRFAAGVDAAEVGRFAREWAAATGPEAAARLAEAVFAHVQLLPPADPEAEAAAERLEQESSPRGERARARRVFWRAVLGTRRVVLRARASGRPDLRQAKRLVQPIVDRILANEYSIVGLAALKDHDEYTVAHCVNVAVLSVAMGRTLGLPRQALADLGVAGLLHDLGKMSVPAAVLRKPGALTPEEWTLVRRHPLEGALAIARMPGLAAVTLDSMRACLEHHMNVDRTGYPEIEGEWGQATLSRIVAVADCFDAITAHRAYHARSRTPFEALQILLGPGRTNFDPAVLWALVASAGLYPAGTVMQTASGHLVLATSPNPLDPSRPRCRVLVRPDGAAPGAGDEVWDPMPAGECVVRVLIPEEHGFDTDDLLAAA